MRVLLDTHILLWWLSDSPNLGDGDRQLIADADNDVLVSAVSVAEIAIKSSLGKLAAPPDIAGAITASGFDELPLTASHAQALRALPWHHRDPFDRLLIAQAKVEQIPLISTDDAVAKYF